MDINDDEKDNHIQLMNEEMKDSDSDDENEPIEQQSLLPYSSTKTENGTNSGNNCNAYGSNAYNKSKNDNNMKQSKLTMFFKQKQ